MFPTSKGIAITSLGDGDIRIYKRNHAESSLKHFLAISNRPDRKAIYSINNASRILELQVRVTNMTHFSVLPSDVLQLIDSDSERDRIKSPDFCFLRVPHPRTGLFALFLPTERLSVAANAGKGGGILEVQAVSPPDERSWILDEEITANGTMLVMTPIDPAFLLLPLIHVPEVTNGQNIQYRTSDDILQGAASNFEIVESNSQTSISQLRNDLIQFCSLECTRKALQKLCEIREVSSDIVVYRYSFSKTIEYLRAKVMHLETSPAFDALRTVTRILAKDCLMDDGQECLLKLGRLRACCDLMGQYLSAEMRDALVNSYDFSTLNEYVESKKVETMSKAAMPPLTKVKFTANKETAAPNKKRKAGKTSQGVENLKRVNTSGMAKISSFFNKGS